MELSLTGMPVPVTRRPGSASPAKHVVRSVSVVGDGKTKRNALVGDAVLGKSGLGWGALGAASESGQGDGAGQGGARWGCARTGAESCGRGGITECIGVGTGLSCWKDLRVLEAGG